MIKRIIEVLAVGTTHLLLQFALIFIGTDGLIILGMDESALWLTFLPYIIADYVLVSFLLPILIRRVYSGNDKKLLLHILLVPALSGIIVPGLVFICGSVIGRDISTSPWLANALFNWIVILIGEAFAILIRKLLLSFFNWMENVKSES